MNPLRLRAASYRTFEQLDLPLPSGCVAIVGEVAGGGATDSNGAGKSTLVNAIDLALFGPDGRSWRPLLSWGGGSTELMVELEFEHGGELYRVRRGFSARGAGKSTLDLERWKGEPLHSGDDTGPMWDALTLGSAKETQARLEEILGFTRPTFRASSFLVQEDAGAFTRAEAADRKKILHRALGLDRFEKLLAAVRRDRRAAEQETARIDGRLQGVTAAQLAADHDTLAGQRAALEKTIEQANLSLAGAEAALIQAALAVDEAKTAAAVREGMLARRDTAAAALAAKTRIRDEADEARPQLKSVKAELLALPTPEQLADHETREADLAATVTAHQQAAREHEQAARLAELRATEKKTIEAQAAAAKRKAEELDTTIAQVIGGELAHCPTCEQTLGEAARDATVGSLRAQAQTAEDEAAALFERAAAIEIPEVGDPPTLDPQAPVALDTVRALLRAARDAEISRARLTERAAQLNDRIVAAADTRYLDELAAARAALEQALGTVANLPEPADMAALEAQAVAARGRVEVYRAEQTAARQEKAVVEERLAQLAARAAQHEHDLAARTTLQADLDLLAILERAYGPDGIPALILENAAIPQVETEASRLLALLGGPVTRVELRTDRAKQDGGVRDDVLDIVCVTETAEADYKDFSGGEKFRVDVALRLALAQLLATRRGAECRLLVIDEPAGLDASGKQALIEILRDLESRGGLDKIYVISHDADLRDSFDTVLQVVKDAGGRSRVEGGEAVAA